MKLVCDACGTKYSISDDKVAGKVFKIRCKKCSNVIVVRGVVASVEAPAATTTDEWHAVIDGQQLGPFDSTEVSRRRAAGELDDDSYVWREGMTDWVPLGSIDAFRAPVVEAPPSETDDRIWAEPAREVPAAAEATRLRGERNESSVLFTLGNLAKLASPQPSTSTPSTGGEGSGLIDIRALASTLAPPAAKAQTTGSMADLPVYAPTGFGEPIVLVPMPRRRAPERRLVIALVALVAMLVVVATVLIVVLTRSNPGEQVVMSPAPAQIASASVPRLPATEPVVAPPVATSSPIATPSPAPAPASAPAIHTPPPSRTPAPARRPVTPAPATPAPRTPSQLQLHPAAEETKCTDVSCAFSNYAEKCCEPFKPASMRTTTTTANSQLPDDLDRNMLKAGIATIKAQACGGKSSARGDVNVSVKVSPAGAVASVNIKNSPDAALSACVTAAVQKGTFAKTKRGGSFAYFWRF